MKREPNFNNIIKVLNKEIPDRPTLFEFFMNWDLYSILSGMNYSDVKENWQLELKAFINAGYDYVTMWGDGFYFPANDRESKNSVSLNDGFVITNRKDFEEYKWPDPEMGDYSSFERIKPRLPDGMKLIVAGSNGILENVIALVGYDNLCFMLADEPDLAKDLFDAVGSRFVRYYDICAQHDTVGAIISNDDWGFKTQTMLDPKDMRKYLFPWHKKIVEAAHKAGKPAILHSCGNFRDIWDDLIYDMKFDGKHSYEDAILPVEESYDLLAGKIAVLGGIDLDFICRETPENIEKRCRAMVEKGMTKGGYALGTGNSVPSYVPNENYFAMLRACDIILDLV